MKLVHWPLMGGLLARRGLGGLRYQSPYSCIMVRCSGGYNVPIKGLRRIFKHKRLKYKPVGGREVAGDCSQVLSEDTSFDCCKLLTNTAY